MIYFTKYTLIYQMFQMYIFLIIAGKIKQLYLNKNYEN